MALVAFLPARRIKHGDHRDGSDLSTPETSGFEDLFFGSTGILIPNDTLAIDIAHRTIRWKQFQPFERYHCPSMGSEAPVS